MQCYHFLFLFLAYVSHLFLPPVSGHTDCIPIDTNKTSSSDIATDFALRLMLYTAIGFRRNLLVSPMSLWSSLANVNFGSDENSCRELASALTIFKNMKVPAINVAKKLNGSMDTPTYIQMDYQTSDLFKKVMYEQTEIDFKFGITPHTIRSRVRETTKYRIRGLIPSNKMAQFNMTKYAAVNSGWATYYWRAAKKCCQDYFHPLYGFRYKTVMVEVPGPIKVGYVRFFRSTLIQYFFNDFTSMILLLPNHEEDLEMYHVVFAIDSQHLQNELNKLNFTDMTLYIPKFTIDAASLEPKMIPILKRDFNVRSAFNNTHANFRYFSNDSVANLYMSDVFHKSIVTLDEKSVRSAFASMTQMFHITDVDTEKTDDVDSNESEDGDSSTKRNSHRYVKPCHTCIKFNRPFLFMLRDERDFTVWQLGIVQHVNVYRG